MSLALMPDSPAIDAASPVPGVNSDQRGVPRPFGPASAVGAYEWNASAFYSVLVLYPLTLTNGAWHLRTLGPTGFVRLERSVNLSNWISFATNATDLKGFAIFDDPTPAATAFYRAITQ